MIDATTEAEILRLFRIESWPIGTIARHLRLHHSAVERIVRKPADLNARRVRPTIIEPFIPFITETLEQFPDLTSRRLYDMCIERGYVGAPDHFGATLRRLRPEREKHPEAFLQLTTLIGEQGQVDWGSFGTISIGRAHRQLQAFTMVLSWSRMIFLRFFVGAAMPCFLRGHVEALTFFGGVPRRLLYDNLKSAVLERYGRAIRFNPTIIALAKHYSFDPRPVTPARGEHKGRVERGIRFVRTSFFAGRTWTNLDDLNRQAFEWCQGRAASRKWREDRTRYVSDAFQEERLRLTPLPGTPFPCDDVTNVRIQKTPYAHFDSNQYSVPHRYVMKTLTVAASETEVRLSSGLDVVAVHARCYDKGQVIEKPEHLAELRAKKRRAEHGQASSVLFRAAPSALPLLQQIGERGQNLGAATNQLLKLLERFGGTALESAVVIALERGTPNPRSVRTILEVAQARHADEPAVPVQLPNDPRVHGLVVQSHDLALYDQLHRSGEADVASKPTASIGVASDEHGETTEEEASHGN